MKKKVFVWFTTCNKLFKRKFVLRDVRARLDGEAQGLGIYPRDGSIGEYILVWRV